MTPLSRRAVIASGGAALLANTLSAAGAADARLHAMLDRAVPPEAMLRALDDLSPAALSPAGRLDLATARAGLVSDAALARETSPRARYPLLLRRLCGDDVEPDAARRRIAREHRRLTARADALLRRLGHRDGAVGPRLAALWRDPRHLYGDDDTGRDRAVADMNRTLAAARAAVPAAFGALPPACLDVRVRRMVPADEAAGRGGYRDLPEAGRGGAYVVDLKHIRRRPAWTLPAVVHHELLPGHMIQLPIEAAARPHPSRLRYAAGFAEGWAIYAEQRALTDVRDPLVALGHIHWLLFRTGRALADLGIHLGGWSVAEARARLVAWQGEPAYFAPFDDDLARIVREPAVRVAEALTWLTIADLAAAWRGRPAAFHRQVLADGRKRTDLLRRIVERENGVA